MTDQTAVIMGLRLRLYRCQCALYSIERQHTVARYCYGISLRPSVCLMSILFLNDRLYISSYRDYKVVCVHMSGDVDSFNAHSSAFIAIAACQIWRKSVNNFLKFYPQKSSAYFLWKSLI